MKTDLPSKVVVIQGWGITVGILFSAHEVFTIVEVQGVVLVAIWSTRVPEKRTIVT